MSYQKTFKPIMTFFWNPHVIFLLCHQETFYGLKVHYESNFLEFIHKFYMIPIVVWIIKKLAMLM
jgi:hypothetical protein